MENLSTSDKILEASIKLFSQKGYDAVTMKEIAREADVSEMTVFRHFESKRNLFEKAFDKFVFFPRFKALFENNLEWDLERDLLKISEAYQDTLLKNQKIILMIFKNNELTPELESPLSKFPNELKNLLVGYFAKMKEKGMLKENPEVLAVSFLATNFGFFMAFLVMNKLVKNTDIHICIANYVKIFTKGITV